MGNGEAKQAHLNDRGEVAFWNYATGSETWIPTTDVDSAVASGLEPLTFEELTLKRAEVGQQEIAPEPTAEAMPTPDPVIQDERTSWPEAFANKFVSSAYMGAPEAIYGAVGYDDFVDRSERLEKNHPFASGVAETMGTGVSAVLGPLGLLGKAGAGIASNIAGKYVSKSAPAVAKAIQSTGGQLFAKGATEAGAITAADEIVRQAYEEEFKPMEIAKKFSEGMFVGGGLSMLGVGVSKIATKRAKSKIIKTVAKAKKKHSLQEEQKRLVKYKNKILEDMSEAQIAAGGAQVEKVAKTERMIEAIDKELSENRRGFFRQMGRALAFATRNPFIGGAAGVAIITSPEGLVLGIAGAGVGRLLQTTTAKKAAAKAASGLMVASKHASKYNTIKLYSDADLKGMAENMIAQPPEDVQRDALIGFNEAGVDRETAEHMAKFEYDRINAIQGSIKNDTPVKASKVIDALSDPRRIVHRLKALEATREDIQVLRDFFPNTYRQAVAAARKLLAKEGISSKQRIQAELLLNPDIGDPVSRIIQQLNQPVEGSPNPRGKTYNAATNMQRISKGY